MSTTQHKSRCLYCGNNPVIHPIAWFDQTFSVLLNGVNHAMSRWYLPRLLSRVLDRYAYQIVSGLAFIGIVRFDDDRSKVATERAGVLWDEAQKRGIRMRSIVALGRYIDGYVAIKNNKKILFLSLPSVGAAEKEAIWWMDDKALFKKRLLTAGIPVARGGVFTTWRALKKSFSEVDKPVIIKPRVGSRGRHTMTALHTLEELRKGFTVARQLCYFVVMEEHLFGSVYRGTVIDGKVVGILRGDPPRVTGDGVHTISELIDIKNTSRDLRIAAVTITSAHIDFLARNSHALTTVLPSGQTIDLLEKIGVSYGGMSAEVTPMTHPAISTWLEKAAALVEYPIIGFDFIIPDVTKDPAIQKWGIIEANSAPFINLHHDPIEGTPVNVATRVWDLIEPTML